MTLKKKIFIEHIVVLGKRHQEYFHYQLAAVEDIRKDVFPLKVFINGTDFTHRLTGKTRLTKQGLEFILINIWKLSFSAIRRRFSSFHENRRLKASVRKAPGNKNKTKCQSLEAYLAREKRVKLKPRMTGFKKAEDPPATVPSVSRPTTFTAVGYDYSKFNNSIVKASMKKKFDRTFLIYLQCVFPKIGELPSSRVYFDHSVYPYLIDLGVLTQDKFESLVEEIMAETRIPTSRELYDIFRVMEHQGKMSFTLTSTNVNSLDEYATIVYEYLEMRISSLTKKEEKSIVGAKIGQDEVPVTPRPARGKRKSAGASRGAKRSRKTGR